MTQLALIALAMMIFNSCNAIEEQNRTKNTGRDSNSIGVEGENQGFMLSMPEIPDQDIGFIKVSIYQGNIAIAAPEECQEE